MKKNSKNIIQEFDNCQKLLHEFGETINQLLKSLFSTYLIKPHQLNYRIKHKDSLEKKLERKNFKYKKLTEITDLVGFRAITYFEDDIDKIAELIESEFEIDQVNSIDKRQLESDRFGYKSLHYVISLKEERLMLTEYKKFSELVAEIQVRSILQHSWAEIEHDLGYKGESEIPANAKRTFYRVAALLEQADIEFVKLKELIIKHQEYVKEQIQIDPESVEIDKTSLLSFIKEKSILRETELRVQRENFEEERSDDPDFITTNALPRLDKLNIKTIAMLENLYKKNIKKIITYIVKKIPQISGPNEKPTSFVSGGSILWLCSVLEKKTVNAGSERIK